MHTEAQNDLVADFERQRPIYEAFTRNFADRIHDLIGVEGIEYFAIEDRTKTTESLSEKLSRPEKSEKYSNLQDITDLSAIRVITYLREDCDKIAKLIEDAFEIDWPNSSNKEDLIDPDRFGYLSIHYVASYDENRLKLKDFAPFANLKAEIQVRTILQHTWAAIDWKLRYKNDQEAPKKLRRRLYRISALLEAADEDFSYIYEQTGEIKQSYEESLKKGDLSVPVDRESLEIFLENSSSVKKIVKHAKDQGFSLAPFNPGSRNPLLTLLLTLNASNITTINELEVMLKSVLPEAESKLGLLYSVWHTPEMPNKLVMDMGGLIRAMVILFLDKSLGLTVLEKCPFGPTLQNAVKRVIMM